MAGAGAALTWDAAESRIDRFNKPLQRMEAQTYGFQGFPDNNMFEPKRPLRHQPSADVTTDVNRYFRKDSPGEWNQRRTPQQSMMTPNRQRESEWMPPRRDSAENWRNHEPAPQQRMQSPPHAQESEWMPPKRDSPPPQPKGTISPRYNSDQQMTNRPPVIRDPLGELTETEKMKKIEEHYQAEQDLAMAQRRREEQKMAKIEDQRRVRELQDSYKPWGRPGGGAPNRVRDMQNDFNPYGLPGGGAPITRAMMEDESLVPYGRPGGGAPRADNRKMKFTEYQLNKPSSPKYAPRFDEHRGMDGVRSSMEMRKEVMGGRKEDLNRASTMPLRPYSDSFTRKHEILRQQEREIDSLRRNLERLENERQYDNSSRGPRADSRIDKMEMLEEQAKQLRHVQDEISRLKAQDDMDYRSPRGMAEANARSQSEPQTDRPYGRRQMDRNYFGQSEEKVPDYLNVSPRRRPARAAVGQFYNTESTYAKDFDLPTVRHGNRNLGNPNAEPFQPFSPFGLEGGGAPMVDATGQRRTRIAGSMGRLGRELSDSARARRFHKTELLESISEQAAYDRARKDAEKRRNQQNFVELTDVMRDKKVGYPKFKPSGLIDNHHLPHMFKTDPVVKNSEKRELYNFLSKQVEEKYMHDQLGTMEARRQAKKHYITQDGFFGRRGGGNIKGDDLRKVNLERAIHNPTSTLGTPKNTRDYFYVNRRGDDSFTKMNYQGRTPYAEF
ncbi:hypothetical protein ACF0H5_012090 [Mactra antiquata]